MSKYKREILIERVDWVECNDESYVFTPYIPMSTITFPDVTFNYNKEGKIVYTKKQKG